MLFTPVLYQFRAMRENGMVRWTVTLLAAVAFGQPVRVVESIVPALAFGPACSSVLELRNLGDREAVVDVEGHRASGAMVALAGRAGTSVRLAGGERGTYKLEIAEETTSAWAKVREHVPAGRSSPAVAVSASTECIVADRLRTVSRDVAFPTRNPWFSSDSGELRDGVISLINTTERAATASACYSAGSLYSVPEASRGGSLQPVCSTSFVVQVPPFGSREFPVVRDGSSHFTLKTAGDGIVLEMLRPLAENERVYRVDSSIRFEGEVKRE
jgi:hypothetical protein